MPKNTVEKTKWYLAIDGDDMGHLVEESLIEDDTRLSKKYEQQIIKAFDDIRDYAQSKKYAVLFSGGDNMLIAVDGTISDVVELYKKSSDIYKQQTNHTLTGGAGTVPSDAHRALVVGKNTGKAQLVLWDSESENLYNQIKDIQRKIIDCEEKIKKQTPLKLTTSPALKYKAERAVMHYRRLLSIGYEPKVAARFVVSIYNLGTSDTSKKSTPKKPQEENALQKYLSDGETAWALYLNRQQKPSEERFDVGQKVIGTGNKAFGRIAYIGRRIVAVEWLSGARERMSTGEFSRRVKSGILRVLPNIRTVGARRW